ncbi:restriction endonuclease subunit S [Vibrio cholerae]
MSHLSYMEKLLDGVEVEWKELAELGELVRGNGLPKTDFTDTGVPAIHYGQIYTHYGLSTETTLSFVSPATAKKLKKVDTGDVVITNTSENLEDVGKALVYLGEQQAVTGGHATIFKPSKLIIGKYFAYFTQTSTFFSAKRKLAKGTKVIDVSATDMAKIEIPIPCPDNPEKSLAIQAEIVRILDAFTAMTAELTAELNLRKKQYNYYRDQLLSFEEGDVEWKTLGEIGEFIRGKRFTKKDYVTEGGVRVIHYGEIYTHYGTSTTHTVSQVRPELAESLRYAEPNDVIVSSVSETIEDVAKAVAWLGRDKVAIHDDSYAIRHSLNPKYLSYCLQTKSFTAQKIQYVSQGKVKRLLIDGASKVKIPIPYPNDPEKSRAEQDRIVNILDKFDTLTTSLQEGLPREIELRQKQYEYYRDLLLNFPKPDEAA